MEFKVGQKVKLVTSGCRGDTSCCKNNGFIIGNIYEITRVVDRNRVSLKSKNGSCSFNGSCVKPINNSLKTLLED